MWAVKLAAKHVHISNRMHSTPHRLRCASCCKAIFALTIYVLIIIIFIFSSFVILFGLQFPLFCVSFVQSLFFLYGHLLGEMLPYGIIASTSISMSTNTNRKATFYNSFIWIYVNASCGYEPIVWVYLFVSMNISGAEISNGHETWTRIQMETLIYWMLDNLHRVAADISQVWKHCWWQRCDNCDFHTNCMHITHTPRQLLFVKI